eukprot:Pgem_evm1s11849
MLLTNDGVWSRFVTLPASKVGKNYIVTTRDELNYELSKTLFARGLYLADNNITLRPAGLEKLDKKKYRVTIFEGRRHQVKRMFFALGNKVASLHRESIGLVCLDPALNPGDWRYLTENEIDYFVKKKNKGSGDDDGVQEQCNNDDYNSNIENRDNGNDIIVSNENNNNSNSNNDNSNSYNINDNGNNDSKNNFNGNDDDNHNNDNDNDN